MLVGQINQTKYVENQYIFNIKYKDYIYGNCSDRIDVISSREYMVTIYKQILLITQVKQYTSFVITVYARWYV